MLFKVLALICFAGIASGQRRYYSLEDMPETNFDCRDKILGGYYADPEANCQMFHVCVKIPGQGVQDFRFLCPNETVFDQENQICADSGDIDCAGSGLYLENFDLYRLGSAPSKRPLFNSPKGTVVPLGPSTKSPILTNNINEDDDFYLQRSDTGDRRLHSKDLLKGSSSSNFFNNRNKGKDLDDDDDDEPLPRTPANNNGQYRPRPSNPVRPKTQYNSQFRRVENNPQTQPTQQPSNQNQLNDDSKKKTKIAVRKLARKRLEDEAETKATSLPTYSSFTTQVTQKYSFNDVDSRYSTINRVQSTTATPTQTTRYQQSFRTNQQQSTPAFFEPSVTQRTISGEQNNNAGGNALRQPVVAGGAGFQNNQNRPTPGFPQNRQSPSPTAGNPAQNFQNKQGGQNFQQGRQQTQPNVPSPKPSQQPGNINFQGPRVNQGASPSTNFPSQRTNSPTAPTNIPSSQPLRPSPPANQANFQTARVNNQDGGNQNFQAGRTNQSPAGNFQQPRASPPPSNYPTQGRTASPTNAGNFQSTRTNSPSSRPVDFSTNQGTRQTTASLPPITRAQVINNGLLSRSSNGAQNRNFYNRDEFDDGDNQEFLKTAPSNNFRPSDLNSFRNTYDKAQEDNIPKTVSTSTIKYYTPTIITTPKPPSTYSSADTSATARQTPPQSSTGQQTQQNFPAQTATRNIQPPTARPPLAPAKTTVEHQAPPKDVAYDYAYYDEGGSFSEYDTLDSLGESDFSRTSQRTKSRLI